MKNLILIETLTLAIYKNATDHDGENFRLTESLLSAIESLTDKEFVTSLIDCGYNNIDWSEIVRQYKERVFVLETETELIKAFEGVVYDDYEIGKALSEENPYLDGYGTFNPRLFWPVGLEVKLAGPKTGLAGLKFRNNFISDRKYVAYCEVNHFTLKDGVISFEATTAKEVSEKVKAILDRSWAARDDNK